MTYSRKETSIIVLALFVLLIGLSYLIGMPLLAEWEKSGRLREKTIKANDEARALINERANWETELTALRGRLPKYRPDQPVTAELLKTIKRTADEHQISISRMEPDKEQKVGDLSEVAIDCMWDGTLDSIVRFLYAVQGQGAILDIRQLTISPAQGVAGRLKGNFTVFCAFSREIPEAPAAAEPAEVQPALPEGQAPANP